MRMDQSMLPHAESNQVEQSSNNKTATAVSPFHPAVATATATDQNLSPEGRVRGEDDSNNNQEEDKKTPGPADQSARSDHQQDQKVSQSAFQPPSAADRHDGDAQDDDEQNVEDDEAIAM